jgi:hypothetical protein
LEPKRVRAAVRRSIGRRQRPDAIEEPRSRPLATNVVAVGDRESRAILGSDPGTAACIGGRGLTPPVAC